MSKRKTRFWIMAGILALWGRDGARGQQKQPVSSLQEDCGVTFSFTAASSGAQAAGTVTSGSTGTTAVIDNRQAGCLDWLVTYSTTTTVTVLSLAFQTATDLAGAPGTWSNYPGTLTSGINPNTAVTTGGAVTSATGPKYPFLRMNMTGFTGPGTVQGKLYGWKRRPAYVTVLNPGTAGCPGTLGTPCVIVGTKTNNNAPPGTNNVGVLPCLATAADPAWTEGDQVLCSVDLSGKLRVSAAAIVPTSDVNLIQIDGDPAVTAGLAGLLAVGGPDAGDSTPTGNPVYIGGLDQADAVLKPIAVDADGEVALANQQFDPGDGISTEQRFLANYDTSAEIFVHTFPYVYDPIAQQMDRMTGNTTGAFVQGADAENDTPTANPVVGGYVDYVAGSVFRDFYCTSSAPITLAASGNTRIITAFAAVRVCSIMLSFAAAVDVKLTQGTGANCGTGTADFTGLLKNVTSWDTVWGPTAALRTAASGNDVCVNVSANTAGGGVVTYADVF